MTPHATPRDYCLWLGLAAMWSSSYAVIKLGVETLDPFVLVAGRMCVGAALMLFVLRLAGLRLSRDSHVWLHYAATGLLGSTIPFWFITYGEQSVDSALAAILMGLAPVATVVLAAHVFPDERLTLRTSLGVACALAGLVALVGPAALSGLGADLWGQLSIVAATFCYAASTVYVKRFVRRPALEMAAGSMLIGASIAVVVVLGRGGVSSVPTTEGLWAILYLGLFSTALANLIYFYLVPRMGATRMSQVNFAVPVGGCVIGVLALGEALTPDRIAALAVICAAVLLVLKRPSEPQKASAASLLRGWRRSAG
ncbi:MAG: DMT family transporter [Pseudomonadota bacterium]